jgi:hypothetical protein
MGKSFLKNLLKILNKVSVRVPFKINLIASHRHLAVVIMSDHPNTTAQSASSRHQVENLPDFETFEAPSLLGARHTRQHTGVIVADTSPIIAHSIA